MIHQQGKDLLLDCFLQPRASRNEIIGEHDGALRIRVTAPPVDGKANQALLKFLADEFAVPLRQVRIESGRASRRKRVRIQRPARVPARLAARLTLTS